ncbi:MULTISPECIES: flagellar type III secretion system pore protein FliP [Microbulbifer]|uniref:flagellar type III secretion system pore protein FliP n=1 Tax=Microbulbifer TaxID=48073 RepID=UPI001E344DBD|nr:MULTISPECIES: flagellar type III secretion system pore protein FliP [Microbulbifer]UHQ56885.1 flagellar type III secretion system pore protein FliP [Microbulbifer sp. YPW16]
MFILLALLPGIVAAADVSFPGVDIQFDDGGADLSLALKILLGMTVLSLAPGILIVMTSFTRIILVLAMLRHALGMQQTPPNMVLVSLALILTLFSMKPVIEEINSQAYQPYTNEEIGSEAALDRGVQPLRSFMLRQTREEDLELIYEIMADDPPGKVDDVELSALVPAFLLSELRTAFQIGFIIFIPFLLVDIVVASMLMSLGMMMVPPMMISLPIKILVFVLIDGWSLVTLSLMNSFV